MIHFPWRCWRELPDKIICEADAFPPVTWFLASDATNSSAASLWYARCPQLDLTVQVVPRDRPMEELLSKVVEATHHYFLKRPEAS